MNLDDLLKPGPPAIVQCTADVGAMSTAVWTLRGEEAARGLLIGTLRGTRMRRREGLFDQFGALLQFPNYFGENWDAFLDCLRDLEWLRADGIVLVVFDAVQLLADAGGSEFAIFVDVLGDAADASAESEMPFHVVLQATAEQAPELQSRLAALGRTIPLLNL
ncbi:barstar family protein [Pendulispora rubella]|uniref:Barstar family protein n=1 Tax=Pendulispora rubella TaxID=2741070 RepID=A0ABZ2KX80_9BACT